MSEESFDYAQRVLSSWITFEALNPQPLPSAAEFKLRGHDLVGFQNSEEAPWECDRYRKKESEKAVFWMVYFGTLDLVKAFRGILSLFPDEYSAERFTAKGEVTAAIAVLDEMGRPIDARSYLSCFAWSYGKLLKQQLQVLPQFSEYERAFCGELKKRLFKFQDHQSSPQPLTKGDLFNVSAWVTEYLHLPQDEINTAPFCVRVPKMVESSEAPEPECLNSFFIDDLCAVKLALSQRNIGKALDRYLGVEQPSTLRDIVKDPSLLRETISPTRIPLARWPSRSRSSLVLMQQAAVNHLVADLKESGIGAVNGPPGSGKTTLLRDVVAHVIYTRGRAMANFADPADAFTDGVSIKIGKGVAQILALDPSLIGHEIVVTSSNNSAVENISREIPALDSIAEDFQPALRYFSSIADLVAKAKGEKATNDQWGLVAAVLGNSSNRHSFIQKFWWDEDHGMRSYLRFAAGRPFLIREVNGSSHAPKVVERESPPSTRAEALKRWSHARNEFLRADKKIAGLIGEMVALESVCEQLPALRSEEQKRSGEFAKSRKLCEDHRSHSAVLKSTYEDLLLRQSAMRGDRDVALMLRPGFISRWFARAQYKKWLATMQQYVDVLGNLSAKTDQSGAALQESLKLDVYLQGQLAVLEAECVRIQERLRKAQDLMDKGRTLLGAELVDPLFWERTEEEKQKSSPWTYPALQTARNELFAASINLHRAFIDAAADEILPNLQVVLDIMKGRTLSSSEGKFRASLWATFFLVVPVVSTTFASVARFFSQTEREEIGWVLIDEAGQATPQAAVGAIWRAKRAVVIGDPLQIEPVVPLPSKLISAVCAEFSVDENQWAAPTASAQTLSDRCSWLGASIHLEDVALRIGIPLRVHRRCTEPMFSISNRIAYNDLMVYGTQPSPSPMLDLLGPSGWFEIEGSAEEKWSPEEGEMVVDILSRIFRSGISAPDIFIISPFRVVAHKLRQVILESSVASLLPGNSYHWVSDRIGTVHTFQGKEADTVLFVLGAPSAHSEGARQWAGSAPNLINVATTRAKRAFYVIGHRKAWEPCGYFGVLSEYLPTKIFAE